MTPLTQNPIVNVLVDRNNNVVGVATNIAPLNEMTVIVTDDQNTFNKLAIGEPFVAGASKVN